MQTVDASTRGVAAIVQLAQAISTYYGDSVGDVIADAINLVGAKSLDSVHKGEHGQVIAYLAGRLSLPG